MLIDKHEADNILNRIPALTIKMSPELAVIDQVLDDDELFNMIRNVLAQRYPKTLTAGRKSTPVEVILHMLAIKHLYDLSYEQTELQVADSLVLRQFCRVYLQAVPDQSTLCRWANLIQPETLQAFNHPPCKTNADRGVHSADNEAYAANPGVKRVILPKPGRKSETRRKHERQRWFWRGRRFHAGVEGRISVIKGKYGFGQCRNRGRTDSNAGSAGALSPTTQP